MPKLKKSILLLACAFSIGALAETDWPWQFDASGRPARIVAPAGANGSSTAVLANPSCVEAVCNGIKTPGMYMIFR